jgi:hypothetical protein
LLRHLSAGVATRHTLHYEIAPESRAALESSPAPAPALHSSPVIQRK